MLDEIIAHTTESFTIPTIAECGIIKRAGKEAR